MLNPTNHCSELEIKPITLENPYKEMYLLQAKLQLRLNPSCYDGIEAKSATEKTIYWFYCIASECKELLDWFKPENHAGKTYEQLDQEVRMEAIDILHFVMNIGLEFRITADEISAIEQQYSHTTMDLHYQSILKTIYSLQNSCIDFIEYLPWKTWKNYEAFIISDFTPIVKPYYEKIYRLCLYLCNKTGLDRQAIIDHYFAKNAENHQRQDNGY